MTMTLLKVSGGSQDTPLSSDESDFYELISKPSTQLMVSSPKRLATQRSTKNLQKKFSSISPLDALNNSTPEEFSKNLSG